MRDMNALDWIAFILVVIGGLNWGLIGLFEFNLVAELFDEGSTISGISRVIYTLVGLATIYLLVSAITVRAARGRFAD